MKIGDKVFCVNNYYGFGRVKLFNFGDEYEICSLSYEFKSVAVSFAKGDHMNVVFGIDEIFTTYFMDIKEYRKMKLEKIYESR